VHHLVCFTQKRLSSDVTKHCAHGTEVWRGERGEEVSGWHNPSNVYVGRLQGLMEMLHCDDAMMQCDVGLVCVALLYKSQRETPQRVGL